MCQTFICQHLSKIKHINTILKECHASNVISVLQMYYIKKFIIRALNSNF